MKIAKVSYASSCFHLLVAIGDGGCDKTTNSQLHTRVFQLPGQLGGGAGSVGQSERDYCGCLRPLSCPDVKMVLTCFSVVFPNSFQNNPVKGTPEISHFYLAVPIFLVGNKKDLT